MNDSEIICTDHCQLRGVCMDGTLCGCYSGIFGDTCEETLTHLFPVVWPVIQYILASVYLFFFLSGVWITCELIWEKNVYDEKSSGSRKISIQVMAFYTFYEFTCVFIFFIDPFGGEVLPYWLLAIWMAYRVVFGVLFLGLMLAHWVEVYHQAILQFKKVRALERINSKYKGEVTFDEIVQRTHNITRFRIPYYVAVIVISIFQIPVLITQLTYSPAFFTLSLVNLVFLALFFAIFCIGFVIYGRRLHQIMPPHLQKRLRGVNLKVNIYCIVTVVALVVYALWNFFMFQPWAQVVYYTVNTVQQWPLTLMIYSIYARFDWKKFRILRKQYSEDTQQSSNIETEMKEESATSSTTSTSTE